MKLIDQLQTWIKFFPNGRKLVFNVQAWDDQNKVISFYHWLSQWNGDNRSKKTNKQKNKHTPCNRSKRWSKLVYMPGKPQYTNIPKACAGSNSKNHISDVFIFQILFCVREKKRNPYPYPGIKITKLTSQKNLFSSWKRFATFLQNPGQGSGPYSV